MTCNNYKKKKNAVPKDSCTGTQPNPFYLHIFYGCIYYKRRTEYEWTETNTVHREASLKRLWAVNSIYMTLWKRHNNIHRDQRLPKSKGHGKLDYKGKLEKLCFIMPSCSCQHLYIYNTPNGVNYIIKGETKDLSGSKLCSHPDSIKRSFVSFQFCFLPAGSYRAAVNLQSQFTYHSVQELYFIQLKTAKGICLM